MKKNIQICLIFSFILHLLVQPVVASSLEMESKNSANSKDVHYAATNSCHSLDAGSALLGAKKIIDNAKSAIVYESISGTLMYAWNADEKMYPASLVKIMTALVAIEEGNLSDVATVSKAAISSLPIDAVSADLIEGEQITLEDLLYCLLVSSANDAAAVIAEHISGSVEEFVALMNSRAQDFDCTATHFINPHGLHNDSQYTTARDSARILNIAMKNETFRKIFTTVKHTVPKNNKSDERVLVSGNLLMDTSSKLYYDERVIGGRTGVTQDGRRCIAVAAEKNGMILISIVMGSDTVYQEDGYSAVSIGGYHETTTLLNAAFSGYKCAQVLYANQALRQCSVIDGDSDLIMGSDSSVSAIMSELTTVDNLTFQFKDRIMTAPIEAGERVSLVQIWDGNICIAEVDLYAMNSVKTINSLKLFDSLQKNKIQWGWGIFILLGIMFSVAISLVMTRIIPKLKSIAVKNRIKRYRRDRRRSR